MRRGLVIVTVLALFALSILAFLSTQLKVNTVYLAGGVAGGAFDRSITHLAEALTERGVDVQIVKVPDSSRNAKELAKPDSPVNAAFVAMPIDGTEISGVSSAGTVAMFPVAIMGLKETTGTSPDIRNLRGTRIEVGVAGSMREYTASSILAEYGITAQNSTFLNASQQEAIGNVLSGSADYFVALVDPLDSRVDEIAGAERLQGVRIPDAQGLSARDGYTVPVVLPTGGFGLNPPIPETQFPTVAVPLTLMVSDSLSHGIVYEIATYLSAKYGRGTVTGLPGEFPNFSDRQVPPHPAAADYYETGKVPWEFEILPRPVADLLLPMILGLSIFLVLATVYQVLFPDSYSLWRGILQPRREERALSRLEDALAEGRELTPSERRLLSRILTEQDRERAHRQRAEAMRSLLDEPVRPDSSAH